MSKVVLNKFQISYGLCSSTPISWMENPKPPVRALLITPSYATDIHRVIFTITTAQDLIKKTKTSRLYSHLDWYTVTGTGVNIWFVLGMGGGYHESQINKYGCIVNIIFHERRCYILIFPPTHSSPRKNEYILVFPPERSVYIHFSPRKDQYILIFLPDF